MPLGISAAQVIDQLGLTPHPEGGHYREIFRDAAEPGKRGAATSIYYLLQEGERSAWHRVDAVEVWSFHVGAPLELQISGDPGPAQTHVLGLDLESGQRPQVIVPKDAWQTAVSLGDWTLVGCVVAPAFDFGGFEMAPPGWQPA